MIFFSFCVSVFSFSTVGYGLKEEMERGRVSDVDYTLGLESWLHHLLGEVVTSLPKPQASHA